MEWFVAAGAVVVLGVAAVAAAGGGGGMPSEPVYDVYRQTLPDRPLTGEDIAGARFGIAFRGYVMGQVDDLLERLGREIAERDARIAALTAEREPVAAPAAPTAPAAGAEPVSP